MFEIGSSLREARTRRGLSPADVHRAIRIRERYLTALEDERWELLPGEAYGKGFLRTYADFLGLQGQLYVDEYNERVAQRDEALPLPEPVRTRRVPVRAVTVVLIVAAAVGALVAWRESGTPSPRPAAATFATPEIVHHAKSKPVVAPRHAAARAVAEARPRARHLAAVGRPQALDITVGGRRVRNLPASPSNLTLTR